MQEAGGFRWCYHHPAPQKKKSESDSAGRSVCVKFPSVECADFLPCTLYVSNHYDNCFQFDYRVVVGPAFRAPHCKGAVAHSHHFPGASPILGRAPFPLFSVCRGFSHRCARLRFSVIPVDVCGLRPQTSTQVRSLQQLVCPALPYIFCRNFYY